MMDGKEAQIMRRIIIALTLLLLLAGCGGTNNTPDAITPATGQASVRGDGEVSAGGELSPSLTATSDAEASGGKETVDIVSEEKVSDAEASDANAPEITAPETAPVTIAPETIKPETTAPGTTVPETIAPETAPVTTEPKPDATKAVEYVGLWQNSPSVGSGYSGRLALNADGIFYLAENQMDSMTRERYLSGTWSVKGSVLTLNIDERILWAGGEVVDDPIYLSGTSISNPEIVLLSLTEKITLDISPATTDPEVMDKRTFMVSGAQYWELAAEPDSLNIEYEEIKNNARIVAPLALLYTGCWETTDRGDERNGIQRVSETLDGKSVSIRADWLAMEIGKNGSYARWEREWSEGLWAVHADFGRAYTDGEYLYLVALSEIIYEGSAFEDIEGISYRAYPGHPCDVLRIIEWDEFSLLLDGVEHMADFTGKGDRPPWSASMQADAISK